MARPETGFERAETHSGIPERRGDVRNFATLTYGGDSDHRRAGLNEQTLGSGTLRRKAAHPDTLGGRLAQMGARRAVAGDG